MALTLQSFVNKTKVYTETCIYILDKTVLIREIVDFRRGLPEFFRLLGYYAS
jgi:hypothetical protein